jgi:hypothetical protein
MNDTGWYRKVWETRAVTGGVDKYQYGWNRTISHLGDEAVKDPNTLQRIESSAEQPPAITASKELRYTNAKVVKQGEIMLVFITKYYEGGVRDTPQTSWFSNLDQMLRYLNAHGIPSIVEDFAVFG